MDEFAFRSVPHVQPKIANDVVVMGASMASSAQVKLAISYALAQSTKLSFFEERIKQQTEETVDLPRMLAATGKVGMCNRL